MTGTLSERTEELLEACLSDKRQRRSLAARLEEEGSDAESLELLERIRFSIVRLVLENHDRD